jgi:hypothetical protein
MTQPAEFFSGLLAAVAAGERFGGGGVGVGRRGAAAILVPWAGSAKQSGSSAGGDLLV